MSHFQIVQPRVICCQTKCTIKYAGRVSFCNVSCIKLTLNGLETSVSFVLLILNLNSQFTIKNQIASCPLLGALQDSHLLQYAINFGVSIIVLNNTSVKFVCGTSPEQFAGHLLN